jgi:hypothetical protein
MMSANLLQVYKHFQQVQIFHSAGRPASRSDRLWGPASLLLSAQAVCIPGSHGSEYRMPPVVHLSKSASTVTLVYYSTSTDICRIMFQQNKPSCFESTEGRTGEKGLTINYLVYWRPVGPPQGIN